MTDQEQRRPAARGAEGGGVMALYRDERGSPQYRFIRHYEPSFAALVRRWRRRAHRRNSTRGPERARLMQSSWRPYAIGALDVSSRIAVAILVVVAVGVLVLIARAA